MSAPFEFDGYNKILTGPPGTENVEDLPVFANGTCCVSAWKLTADELAEINKTGVVFISIFSGKSQPPVYVGSEQSVRDLVSDYGVWKR